MDSQREVTYSQYTLASEFETKVLVDDKLDDAKVMKEVGVAVEQNNDEPDVVGRQDGFKGVRNDTPKPEPKAHLAI
nr:hypothetical protein [Tanacetum cinerariifolium]